MIQANELRKGNWVNCHFLTTSFNSKVLEIKSLGVVVQDGEHKNLYSFQNISGIPITPEMLEKCGYRISFGLYHNGSHRIKSSGRGRFIFMPYGTSDINLHIPIDYLHEFQNLYHAITGTELNVQL